MKHFVQVLKYNGEHAELIITKCTAAIAGNGAILLPPLRIYTGKVILRAVEHLIH